MASKQRLSSPLPVFGLDYSKPGEYIASRATSNGKNAFIRKSVIEKRKGTESAGLALSERVQEFAELDNGSVYYFTRFGPTTFEEYNKATGTWTNRAHASLTGSAATNISYTFPLLSGSRILVYTNGVDPIRKYLGGANDAVLGGSPPIAKFVLFFGNLLLLLNVTDSGNPFPWRVQWPDTGDPQNWTTGDAGSADLLEDSEAITGGGTLSQFATIHKENAIYLGQLTGTSSVMKFERRETGAGAIAHRTIHTLPTGDQFFLSRDGFRLFNGISAPLIESPIHEELREILSPLNAHKSWAKVVKEYDEIWAGVPVGNDEEPSTVYKYNYRTQQVHKDERTNITAMGEYKNTVGQLSWDELPSTWDSWAGPWDSISLSSLNPVYVFGFSDGETTKQNTGSSDNGQAIDLEWDAKDFTSLDFDLEPNLLMRWVSINVWAKGSGTAEIFYSVDSGLSWASAGTVSLASDYPSDFSPQAVYFDIVSTKCRMRIKHNGNNQTFAMKQFNFIAVARERMFAG